MKKVLAVVAASIGLAACSPMQETGSTTAPANEVQNQLSPQTMEGETQMMNKAIVDIAAGNPDFSTLVTAVTEAGLVETLSGEGPFTVFAPTNAAFEKLPAGTLESVLADKEKLTAILTYHVVPGKVMAEDVMGLTSAKTVQGGSLTIDTSNGVMVNNAKVIQTDIEADNGVIHVIDTVLLPE